MIAPDRMDISPTSCAGILEVLFHVLEGEIDLALDVVFVDVALIVPAALARTLDGVADADGLMAHNITLWELGAAIERQ
ncbi:hypothetical protein HG530_000176 [Fusarium avenaceum]|nr:hypothetical protein HG530_000176 [Fusarium avenaceum]